MSGGEPSAKAGGSQIIDVRVLGPNGVRKPNYEFPASDSGSTTNPYHGKLQVSPCLMLKSVVPVDLKEQRTSLEQKPGALVKIP